MKRTKTEARAIARNHARHGYHRDANRAWINCPHCRTPVYVELAALGLSQHRTFHAAREALADHLHHNCEIDNR